MVEDDDDSDYGHSKKRSKKVIRRGRPDKKEKKSPKPRLKATGTAVSTGDHPAGFLLPVQRSNLSNNVLAVLCRGRCRTGVRDCA